MKLESNDDFTVKTPTQNRLERLVHTLSQVSVEVEDDEAPPVSVVPAEDTRLNMNTATAEMIAKRLPGVGYKTAKSIVELKLSLSGERFSNLKQLENIPRVNWDQLIKDDLIFIA